MTIFKKLKVHINFLLDRGYEFSNDLLRERYWLPGFIKPFVGLIARFFANFCLLMKDFPRVTAYRLDNQSWSIVFIGSQTGLKELANLFFNDDCTIETIGRVKIWQIVGFSNSQLMADVHLVVVEHGQLLSFRRIPISFTTPLWVDLQLMIPEDIEELIRGNRHRSLKGKINRFERSEYQYRISHSLEDLEFFYREMYLPFVRGRHKQLALFSSIDFFKFCLRKGGILIVSQDDQPIAGVIFTATPQKCTFVEAGVLGNDPHHWQLGINTYLYWLLIRWAREKQIPILDMGNCHGWASNGSYRMKVDWQARVHPAFRVFPEWSITVGTLNEKQKAIINDIGFITKVRTSFYRIFLTCSTPEEMQGISEKARNDGLSGIATYSKDSSVKYL